MSESESKVGEAIRLSMMTDRMHKTVFDTQIKKTGLHRNQHRILRYLRDHEEIESQKRIADFFEISPAAMTAALKKLEKMGYVERTISENDNRNHRIRPTQKGLDILEDTRRLFSDIDLAMMQGLSEQELEIFILCQQKIQENLRALGASGVPQKP